MLLFILETFQVILLNTNYWSTKCYSINSSITKIGDDQMVWLENQLVSAHYSRKKIIICGHIPPG